MKPMDIKRQADREINRGRIDNTESEEVSEAAIIKAKWNFASELGLLNDDAFDIDEWIVPPELVGPLFAYAGSIELAGEVRFLHWTIENK